MATNELDMISKSQFEKTQIVIASILDGRYFCKEKLGDTNTLMFYGIKNARLTTSYVPTDRSTSLNRVEYKIMGNSLGIDTSKEKPIDEEYIESIVDKFSEKPLASDVENHIRNRRLNQAYEEKLDRVMAGEKNSLNAAVVNPSTQENYLIYLEKVLEEISAGDILGDMKNIEIVDYITSTISKVKSMCKEKHNDAVNDKFDETQK